MASSLSYHNGVAGSMITTELHEVHACLRKEVENLEACARQLQCCSMSTWNEILNQFVCQFDFFFVVYNSHSRAEDEVIIPALVEKGFPIQAQAELEREHRGHHQNFEELRVLLFRFRTGIQQASNDYKTISNDVASLVSKIKASVSLHMKKEEEELFPALSQYFSVDELNVMSTNILGNRSSEIVSRYILMLIKDLPEEEKNRAIESIKNTAKTTRFHTWLAQILRQENNIEGAQITTNIKGSIRTWHRNGEIFGCSHYMRNCSLYFECCQALFPCRLCHDEEVMVANVSPHLANRYEVRHMWCMHCFAFQRVGQQCISCGRLMGKYFCAVCNLVDDDPTKSIYHCPFCNVCRMGKGLGIDFFHCMKCNCCISTQWSKHKCRDNTLEVDCPICLGDLFETTGPLQVMQCGHIMHQNCYNSYIRHNFKCPTCRKSVYDMSQVWRRLDSMWQAVIVSGATGEHADIKCDECNQGSRVLCYMNSSNLPYKCPHCNSYNTFEE